MLGVGSSPLVGQMKRFFYRYVGNADSILFFKSSFVYSHSRCWFISVLFFFLFCNLEVFPNNKSHPFNNRPELQK